MKLNRRSFAALALACSVAPSRADDVLAPGKLKDHTQVLQTALSGGGEVRLGPGEFRVDRLLVSAPVSLQGVPGQTILRSPKGQILDVNSDDVALQGLRFESSSAAGDLVAAKDCKRLHLESCIFVGGERGLSLDKCAGRIEGNSFTRQSQTGIFSFDATGLMISGNTIEDIGNNGIQVWRRERGEDGTQVIANRVRRIAAESGGTGQNGNGIVVFRAGNVIVANNRVSDCVYSGIRNNAGSNIVITGNSISRTTEVALFVEFAFQGAVVSNNVIEDVAYGICITNFDVDGRLAVCSGNVIRRVTGAKLPIDSPAIGIHAEADTIVSNNILEDVKDKAIRLGWGGSNRNLSAIGNTMRNCGVGIAPSVAEGSGNMKIANNTFSGSTIAAVQGFKWTEAATGDLLAAGAQVPAHITLSDNTVIP